jgi:four helix bundle protein
MSRDHNKLKVFAMADQLVLDVYRVTKQFPLDERFGMQSQLRRAAVSVPTNIVEGCVRLSGRDYVRFLDIALASATEAQYLITLARRLLFIDESAGQTLTERYGDLLRALQAMINTLGAREVQRA